MDSTTSWYYFYLFFIFCPVIKRMNNMRIEKINEECKSKSSFVSPSPKAKESGILVFIDDPMIIDIS